MFDDTTVGIGISTVKLDTSTGWGGLNPVISPPQTLTINGKALSSNITLGNTYTATLLASGWTTDAPFKKQTLSITGIKASYNVAPLIDLALDQLNFNPPQVPMILRVINETANAWGAISPYLQANTANNSIEINFVSNIDTPTVDIPIRITTYD